MSAVTNIASGEAVRLNLTLPVGSDTWYARVSLSQPGSFTFRARLLFVAGLAALLAVLNWYAPAQPTPAVRILASLAIALAAMPTWLWLAGRDRDVPFMPFFGLVFSTYYTIPVFLLNDYGVYWSGAELPTDLIVRALALTLTGLVCVMIGYYGPAGLLLSRVLPRVQMRWSSPGFLKLCGIGFGAAGISLFAVDRLSSLGEDFAMVVAFGADLCIVGICILFALQLVGELDRISTLLLWTALVPVRIAIGLSTGLTSQGLIILLTLIFVYATLRHRIPWAVVIAGALAFTILRPIESVYRMVTWRGGSFQNASEFTKVKVLWNLVAENLEPVLEGHGTAYDTMLEISSRRLGTDILTFAAVLGETPRNVPYWRGASYYPLLFKPIPRFIYHDKPEEVTGQTFGHRYGLLDIDNFETSYNLPQLIEFYINFGVGGVIIGMLLLGVLYRAILGAFVHSRMGFGALIAAIYVAVNLLQIESAASIIFGNVMWAFIYFALLNLFVQSGGLSTGWGARS